MVTDEKQHSSKTPAKQGPECIESETNKINASTPFDFTGKNLTPYGGLLPVITMLEKLGFQSLVEQTLTSKRIPRAMDLYRFWCQPWTPLAPPPEIDLRRLSPEQYAQAEHLATVARRDRLAPRRPRYAGDSSTEMGKSSPVLVDLGRLSPEEIDQAERLAAIALRDPDIHPSGGGSSNGQKGPHSVEPLPGHCLAASKIPPDASIDRDISRGPEGPRHPDHEQGKKDQ